MSEKKIIEVVEGRIGLIDPDFDASVITTGTIDPARLPPTGGVIVASGDITTLTPTQQAAIIEGTQVVLGSDGTSHIYTGSGSKTNLASYVTVTATVGWSSVTGKPDAVTAVGALTPSADHLAYYTGPAAAAMTDLTGFGRSLIGATDAAAGRTALACLPTDSPSWTSELSGSQMTIGSYRVRAGDSATPVGDGDVVVCSASRIRGWFELKWSTSNREETVFAYVAAGQFDAGGASIQILGRYSYLNQSSISGLKILLSADSATVYLVATLANRNSGLLPIRCLYSGTDPIVFGGSMPVGASTIKSLTLETSGVRASSLGSQDLAGTGTRSVTVDSTGKLLATTQSALWADTAKTFNANSTWLSALSASSASRKISANTWTAGRVLEFKYRAAMPTFFGASTPDFEFTIGPNGTSGAPYYEYIYGKAAAATAELVIDIVVTVACASAGASGQFNIQWKYIAGYSGGASVVSCGNNSSGQLTTMDTTVDKWIDLWIPSSGNVVGLYSSAKWLI